MSTEDRACPSQVTPEERDLRHRYAFTKMTFKQYQAEYKKLKAQGLIKRGGRIVQ